MWAPTPPGEVVGRLVGRTELSERVLRLLLLTRDERAGRMLVVVGEGGVGKTTVLRSAEATARSLDFLVLTGRALPTDLPVPFGLIGDLLRSEQAERRRSSEAARPTVALPLFAAALDRTSAADDAGRVPADAADPPAADRLLEHLALPAERADLDRSTLFGRLADFFLELAEDRPVVLLLDDLHLADDSSLEFLRRFVPLLDGVPVAIVAAIAPPSDRSPSAAAWCEVLSSQRDVAFETLRPMTEPELGEYVRLLLGGRDPGHDALMRWFSQTEGNPLLAQYLVRAAMGVAPQVPAGGGRSDLEELLHAHVSALTEPEQRVLVYAAVLGREFDFATLARASGQEEERLSEILDRLVHGGLLRERGGEVYEFATETLRANVYARLTETRRRLLHAKAAQAIAERGGGPEATFELARQFYLGRDDSRGVEFNRRAAELAMRAFAFDSAAVHLERALECQRRIAPRDPAAEVHLLIELGRTRDELGDLRRSEEVLLDAVARARALPDREVELALALLGLANTRSDLSQYVSARDLATEAFRILDRLGHARGLMTAHRALGVACWRMGDLPAAEAHQRAGIALAEKDGTPGELGHAMVDLANTLILQGNARTPEAFALYERAAGVFETTQDSSAQARVLMNRALLHHFAGRSAPALADMTAALAAAERSRSRIWTGYCSLNLAQFHVEAGATARAREEIDRAAALLEPLGDQLAHQQATMIRGMIAEADDRLPEAEARFTEALAQARALSLKPEEAEMHYRLAALAFRRGDPETAGRELDEARRAGIGSVHVDLLPRVEELEARLAAGVVAGTPHA